MEIVADFKINKSVMNKIENFPSKFLKNVARSTLDASYSGIPLSHNVNGGRLRSSSLAYGVKTISPLETAIGSNTYYAKYVWKMNNDRTNWSTAGTGSQWYLNTWKKKGNIIIADGIKKSL